MTPLIDKLRNTVLGLYGEYLRPHIGTHLDQGIKHVQYYLDSVAPGPVALLLGDAAEDGMQLWAGSHSKRVLNRGLLRSQTKGTV
ncbi:14 kDa apolipoprotein-like [Arapaima gigas]